jgi:hypothetical protein
VPEVAVSQTRQHTSGSTLEAKRLRPTRACSAGRELRGEEDWLGEAHKVETV